MPRGVYERRSPDDRFDSMVDRSGDCHLWVGPLSSTGYANFWYQGRYIGAHVYAWTRVHGPLPDGHVVRHGPCRTRHCVNVEHLSEGTKADNNRDRQRDKTQRYVITNEQLSLVRKLHSEGVSYVYCARTLGVNLNTLYYALRYRGVTRIRG